MLLSVRNLSKSFRGNPVLRDISFDLDTRESLVIIGGSGSGKSVLLRCIWGLIEPDSGEIWIDDTCVSRLSARERAPFFESFSFLFQAGALFDSLAVWENVAFVLLQKGMKRNEARDKAIAVLEQVDLKPETADIYPSQLSGGMQKRVALARALMGEPRMICFDEPTTGLDPIVSSTINELIVRHVVEKKIAAITITHDMKSLRTIAQKAALLFNGTFVWEGKVDDINTSKDPYIRQFVDGSASGPLTEK